MSKKLAAVIFSNVLINNFGSYNGSIFKNVSGIKKKQLNCKISLISSFVNNRRISKCKRFLKVIKSYPDDVFFSHFRMKRRTFLALETMLKNVCTFSKTGRPTYTLQQRLYVTLWKLTNQCSFREVSDRFGIGKGTVHRIFKSTIATILKLKKRIIKWPKSEESQHRTIEEFERKLSNPFPFVLGCLDGTHFKIPSPKEDSSSYYNRKGTHSIIMQGVCDSNLVFLDAFVSYPGSCHDASVWRESPLQKAIRSHDIKIPPECHLLGDSAYPLGIYLMVPYKDYGHLTPEQKRFNYCHSSTRVFIEQAFGVLKKKFRILNFIPAQNVSLAKQIVMTCVILHNFIITHETPDYVDYNSVDSQPNEDYSQNENIPVENNEAKFKKEQLTTLFSA